MTFTSTRRTEKGVAAYDVGNNWEGAAPLRCPYTDAASSVPSSALYSVLPYSIGFTWQSFLVTSWFFSSGAGTQDLVHAG